MQQLTGGHAALRAKVSSPATGTGGGKQGSPTQEDLAVPQGAMALGQEPARHVNLREA